MAKNLGGRPLKFKTVEELEEKINAYFESCWTQIPLRDKKGNAILSKDKQPIFHRFQSRPYTITGLALSLDTNRQTLLEYQGEVEGRGQKDPRYADAIKKAKQRIENFAEEKLFDPELRAAGIIFNLTNNHGWRNEKYLDHSTKGKPMTMPGVIKVVQPAPPKKDAE